MRKFLIVFCLLLICLPPANACDVSLFALVSGNSPNKAFAEKLTSLVGLARAVANNSENRETLPGHLQQLMTGWMEFSNTYQINPPEWAKKDAAWQDKLNKQANLIGSIRKNLASQEPDQAKTHRELQKFTRQLTRLYDSMEMDELSRLLLDISMHIDHVWDAWWNQNSARLVEATATFSAECEKLLGKLDKESAKSFKDLAHRAGELHKMAGRTDVFAGKSFEFMLNMTENDFARFNDTRKEKSSEKTK